MLCDDCQQLVQKADKTFVSHEDNSSTAVKREVSTQTFQDAVERKCYLCTRLLVQLGDEKWQHILNDLPTTNVVVFDKSAHCDAPTSILVRLGCKLTPITKTDEEGKPLALGKGYSYGYLQVALLPRDPSRLHVTDLTSPEAPPNLVSAAGAATSTADLQVLDLIRHWLESCISSTSGHPICSQQLKKSAGVYPLRLIDVSPDDGSGDRWRLVEAGVESITGPYLTLSHRWGPQTIKLDRDIHHDMVRGMAISVLPRTYRDAIKVARHLKVRYLWIDSICIFQDERLDIQKEAIGMAEVFGNALANISALCGKADGFFCSRNPEIMNSDSALIFKEDLALNNSYLINDLQLWRAELLHMPLTTRGQVLWDCGAGRACETYPLLQLQGTSPFVQRNRAFTPLLHVEEKQRLLHDDELEPIIKAVRVARFNLSYPIPLTKPMTGDLKARLALLEEQEFLFNDWKRFVAHYSLRALSFPDDKLLAIAGVSKLFGQLMQDRFVAGLWQSHLMEGLLWYIRANTVIYRPLQYRAPSWSWASSEGYVIQAEPFSPSWTVARSLKLNCETVAGDEFGMVTSAQMTLQACCLQMRVNEGGDWTAFRDRYKVPRLIVRLDTNEDVTGLEEMYAVIIRTTAYRLTDKVDTSASFDVASGSGTRPKLDSKGKILLAAQGIILTHESQSTLARQPSVSTPEAPTARLAGRYRRIGYFALEDRKSGTLTPKWVPSGCRIFPSPSRGCDDEQANGFPFPEQWEFLSTLEIV